MIRGVGATTRRGSISNRARKRSETMDATTTNVELH